jgi:7-cyano-7-deazaguanine synthase
LVYSQRKKAVVVISGGLDSSGAAAFWKKKGVTLYLVTFNYGQRASQEIKRAKEIGKILGAKDHQFIDISFMKRLYGKTNVLTDYSKRVPSTFRSDIIVPIRNAVFLTISCAFAFSIGANVLAYGAHLTDRPYPDCRPEFAKGLAKILNLGDIDAIRNGQHPRIKVWSPAIQGLQKHEMLNISYQILGSKVFRTWSCYMNGKVQCGKCESCRNRVKSFDLAGIEDLTIYSQQ